MHRLKNIRISRSTKGKINFWSEVQQQYLAGGSLCDLELRFHEDGTCFRCHKMVLASVSDLVKKALLSADDDADEPAILYVSGSPAAHVSGLVDFLYAFLAAGEVRGGYAVEMGALHALGVDLRRLGEVAKPVTTTEKGFVEEEHPVTAPDHHEIETPIETPSSSEMKVFEEDWKIMASCLQPSVCIKRVKVPRGSRFRKRKRDANQNVPPKKKKKVQLSEEELEEMRKPELCGEIRRQIKSGQGTVSVEMLEEPMTYAKAKFDWSPFRVSSLALVGLVRREDQYEALPLSWSLEQDEDPFDQYMKTGEAFKNVFGFSTKDAYYQSIYLSKLKDERKKNVQGQFKHKMKKKLAPLSEQELNDIKEQSDIKELTKRQEGKVQEALPNGKVSICMNKNLRLQELECIVILFVLDTGIVKGRMCKVCDSDEMDKEAQQMSWLVLHVWSDPEISRQVQSTKGRAGLNWSPITRFEFQSAFLANTYYKIMPQAETLNVALEFLKNPEQKEQISEWKSAQCCTCGKTFPLNTIQEEAKYSVHTRKHYFEDFPCDCGIQFDSYNEKKWHVMLHHDTGRKYEKCEFCPFVSNKSILRMHVRKHHAKDVEEDGANDGREHRCGECGQVFKHRASLSRHHLQVHKSLQCQVCQSAHVGANALNLHVRTEHPDAAHALVKFASKGLHNHTSLCSLCGRATQGKHQHFVTMHKEHRCPHCEQVLHGSRSFFNHCAAEHPETCEKHVCTVCGKIFLLKNALYAHMRRSHPADSDKRFHCDLCHRVFTFRSDLERHKITMHLKTLAYKCRVEGCSQAFYDLSARYGHEKKMHGRFKEKSRPKLSFS